METVSVVIVTHQSESFIGEVLGSLEGDSAGPNEVIVVDSGSTDGTREIVAGHDATWVELGANVGFAEGCHEGARRSTGSVLVFLGHDTTPEPGWLPPLVAAATAPGVGAAMATIVDRGRPDTYNTSGGHLTFVGLAWLSDIGEQIPEEEPELIDVAFPSGAAMAIRTEAWDRFGGFRPDFFMYHEDSDLGWRIRLAGLRVVRSSRSRVRHDYDFSRSPGKMYYLERNRWTLLATNYHPTTLAVLSPALLLTDLGIWVVALRDGWGAQKLRASIDALARRSRWRGQRARIDENRRIGDAAMLATLETRISTVGQIDAPSGVGFVDAVLGGFLRLVLPIVRLLDRPV